MKNELIKSNQLFKENEIKSLFEEYSLDLARIEHMAKFQSEKSETLHFFFKGNKVEKMFLKDLFNFEGAKKALDAHYWDLLMKKTDLLSVMDAKNREIWYDQIREFKTPQFESSVVRETMSNLLLNRTSFFIDKVYGVFKSLSPNHKTNSSKGFQEKMIIDYFLDKYGSVNHSRVEIFDDLREVVAKIMNRDMDQANSYWDLSNLSRKKVYNEYVDFDGGAIRIKLFKKGTVHIELATDIAIELNQFLAKKMPLAIADKANQSKKKHKSVEATYKLLSYQACLDLRRIAESVEKGYMVSTEDLTTVNELGVVFDYFAFEKNKKNLYSAPSVEISEALFEVARTGKLPDVAYTQFFETPPSLAKDMINLLEIEPNDTILEPSAGCGGIAKFLPPKQTIAIEMERTHIKSLEKLNLKEVIRGDFLEIGVKEGVNKIILNPPYSLNRAKTHMKKAVESLTSGKIVALLPASLANHKFGENQKVSEVLKDQFKNASVNVVIIEVWKEEK